MGEDSGAEEADVEEEEEGEEWQDIDVSGMDNGGKSLLLGGVSAMQSVEKAVQLCQQEAIDTIIVGVGTFGVLKLDNTEGIVVKGNDDKEKIIFEGCKVSSTCYVMGVTFKSPPEASDSALVVTCVDKKPPKPVFTNCTFTGGKHVVTVHACAAPVFVACDVNSSQYGFYCFPRSVPELHTGYATLKPTPFYSAKPAPGAEAVVAGTLPAATYTHVLTKEATDEDGNTYWLVITPQGGTVYVKKQDLDYTKPALCHVTGETATGSVGLFCDDAKMIAEGAVIKGHETGCYMQYACKGASLQDMVIEDVSGTGLYMTSGCRTAVRGCKVRGCKHYGLIVDKGGEGTPCGEIPLMCREMESAFVTKDGARYNDILNTLKERKVTINMHKRLWTDGATSQSGTWPPCESQPIFRENVFNSEIRVNNGTAPSFFGNVVVKPYSATAKNKFSLNGVLVVNEEPKVKPLKREEEAEE